MTLARTAGTVLQHKAEPRPAERASQSSTCERPSDSWASLIGIQQALGNQGTARLLRAYLPQANPNLKPKEREHDQEVDRRADGILRTEASTRNLSEAASPTAFSGKHQEKAVAPHAADTNQAQATRLARKVFLHAPAAIQRKLGFEYEVGYIRTQKNTSWLKFRPGNWVGYEKGEVIKSKNGYDITADLSPDAGQSNLEFIVKPIDETKPSEIAGLQQTAREMVADLRSIFNKSMELRTAEDRRDSTGGWVGANEIPRLNGWWWHRFYSRTTNWDTINGQLQMTGGVKIDKLPGLVSGSVLGQQPTLAAARLQGGGADMERQALTLYYQANLAAQPLQPIWRAARVAVNNNFGNQWGGPAQRLLASVIALMAQIPIDTRGASPQGNQGSLLAKTDYARILELAAIQLGRTIPRRRYTRALVETINAILPAHQAVNRGSPVFPATYSARNLTFDRELTLGQWVEWALPIEDPLAAEEGEQEFLPGFDLTTSKHFPGSDEQRKELRAFGTFGSKTDPGNKAILEWRNLQLTIPEQLEMTMAKLAGYVGRVNT
jgi:hypothetical protein